MDRTKKLTLAAAVVGTLATALAALSGTLPPDWALLIAAIGAGLYGLARTITKVAQGTPLSKLLRSTEMLGAAVAALAAIVAALAKVVPPGWSAAVAGLAGGLAVILRVVQTQLAPVLEALEPKDKGASLVGVLFVAALLGLAATLAVPVLAHAECKSVAPLVIKCDKLTLQPGFAGGLQVNFRKLLDRGMDASTYQRIAGLAGYGFAYHGERVTAGAGIYFGVGLSADQPNSPQVSILGTLFDRYGLGMGVQRVPWQGGHVYQWLGTLALNYQAGATTTTFLDALKGFAQACVGAVCGVP